MGNSTDPLDLKIAFIVDPKEAAQSAQLKSFTGTLLKRWGVGKGQQEGGEPQDQPPKGDLLGGAIQRPGAVVPLRVVEGAVAHQCHTQVGLLLGTEEDVDCLFFSSSYGAG